uniref:Predicted protein n=1 Tax=Hordeum vulgare subsp. vulgare TaxID=112509 RepID=F2DXG6_HORVV|nr:predicted protein [Hordeum vulgare subsp. vulgare]
MESSSSGGARARRSGSWGSVGGGGGGSDPFDIPGKGAPVERLKKWRVSRRRSSSLLRLLLSPDTLGLLCERAAANFGCFLLSELLARLGNMGVSPSRFPPDLPSFFTGVPCRA